MFDVIVDAENAVPTAAGIEGDGCEWPRDQDRRTVTVDENDMDGAVIGMLM